MIRKALGLLMMTGTVALFAVACGDDEPTDKYPSTDSFCSSLAEAECKDTAGKCAVTIDVCKQARKVACLGASSSASGRTYTSAKVDACLTATTTAYNAPTVRANLDARDDACARVFAGAKKAADACSNEYDCEGTLVCDLSKKFCATKTARTDAQGCNNAGDICADGLFCDGPPGASFCRKARGLGEACSATIPCVSSAFCNGTTCVGFAASGEACVANEQCTSTYCNPDKKCQTRLYPSETGTCKDFGGT